MEKTYKGKYLQKVEVTDHVVGSVITYKDVKHNRNKASCVCPYCLQVYSQTKVVVNDTYEGKEIVGRDSFHHRSKNNVKAYDYFK